MIPTLVALLAAAALAAEDTPLPPGRYGLRLDTATLQRLPFLGETTGGSRAWILVDLQAGEGGLRQHMRTCAVEVRGPPGAPGRVEVPDAFVAALAEATVEASLRPPVAPGAPWTYAADLGEDHVGYDPARSPGGVPRAAGHPAVTDPDRDGEPGATLLLRVPVFGRVALHVVQRAHVVLRGAVEAPGRVRGGVSYTALEQATLSASNPLFAANPEMRPDPSRSGFLLARVPDDTTCASLQDRLGAE